MIILSRHVRRQNDNLTLRFICQKFSFLTPYVTPFRVLRISSSFVVEYVKDYAEKRLKPLCLYYIFSLYGRFRSITFKIYGFILRVKHSNRENANNNMFAIITSLCLRLSLFLSLELNRSIST